MWKLYLLLKPAIDNREREDFLLDEIEYLLDNLPDGTLVECLNILYDNIPSDLMGIQSISMFLQGIQKNDFYLFVDTMKELANGSPKR